MSRIQLKEKPGGTLGNRVTIEERENVPLAHLIFSYNKESGELNIQVISSYGVTKTNLEEI
jgi:hypothetical protein